MLASTTKDQGDGSLVRSTVNLKPPIVMITAAPEFSARVMVGHAGDTMTNSSDFGSSPADRVCRQAYS
jgi:hypothetical protein